LILESTVTSANIHDTFGGLAVMEECLNKNPNINNIVADKGYRGTFFNYFFLEKNIKVNINNDSHEGFLIKDSRWIVERTFAWLMNSRRPVRVYEKTAKSFLFFVKLANFFLFI